MIRSYIALGSNLDNPLSQVQAGVEALSALPQTALVAASPWYSSPAIGPGPQPDYINGVVALDTLLEPLVLLEAMQAIEHDRGRVRKQRWSARTLDLDLLLYGDQRLQLPSLTVPHPRMLQRQFVLQPLLAIAPHLCTPQGEPVAAIAESLEDQGVRLVTSGTSPTMGSTHGFNQCDASNSSDVATQSTAGESQ